MEGAGEGWDGWLGPRLAEGAEEDGAEGHCGGGDGDVRVVRV